MLNLSESQAGFLKAILRVYQEQDAAFRAEHLQPLWEWSAALMENGSSSADLARAISKRDLMLQRDKLVQQIIARENALFDELAEVLSEEQFQQLHRVCLYRQRIRCRIRHYELPSAALDLGEMLDALYEESPFEPLDHEAFQSLLYGYEEALTSLREQHYRERMKLDAEGGVILASRIATNADDDPAAQAVAQAANSRITQKYQALWKRADQFERRLHELNRVHAGLLADQLPPEASAAFINRFRAAAYPFAYPDPNDIEFIFDAARSIRELTAEQLESIDDLSLLFQHRRDEITERIIDQQMRWSFRQLGCRGYNASEREAHEEEIWSLLDQRSENASQALALLAEVIGPDLMAQ